MSKLHGYCIGATRRLVATPPPGRFYPPPFLSPIKHGRHHKEPAWNFDTLVTVTFFFFLNLMLIRSFTSSKRAFCPPPLIFCIAPCPVIWRIYCKFLFFFFFFFSRHERHCKTGLSASRSQHSSGSKELNQQRVRCGWQLPSLSDWPINRPSSLSFFPN